MKVTLSSELIHVLENFAGINNQFLFNSGNLYKTCDPNRGIFAIVKLETQDFPTQFPIHDLGNFLKCVKIADNPELEVTESLAIIKNNKLKINYRSSNIEALEKRMVDFHSKSELKMGDIDATFLFTQELKSNLQKLRDLNDNDILHVSIEQERINFQFINSSTRSVFELEMASENTNTKTIFIEFDKLKFFPTNYQVSMNSKASKFTTYDVSEDGAVTPNEKVTYIIANRVKGIENGK